MAEIVSLADAVAAAIHDGDAVAMEGFTHLIPFAAGHEVIRQGRRDLTLIRMTPDVIYDQIIGAGCASKLIFSWGGNPGVGSLHRFRDAVENGWPGPLELEEHSHAGMANRYVAGAAGVSLRGPAGLPGHRPGGPGRAGRPAGCPADHLPVHRGDADRGGRAPPRRGGHPCAAGRPRGERPAVGHHRGAEGSGAQCPAGGGHRRGDRAELCPQPGAIVLPGWAVNYIAEVPGGAHPSYALGYSQRDNDFYVAWDAISRERESFLRWLDTDVFALAGTARAGTATARPGTAGEGGSG